MVGKNHEATREPGTHLGYLKKKKKKVFSLRKVTSDCRSIHWNYKKGTKFLGQQALSNGN